MDIELNQNDRKEDGLNNEQRMYIFLLIDCVFLLIFGGEIVIRFISYE